MKDINWELKNLDSLKDYILNDLIADSKSDIDKKHISEAINVYAESYHKMRVKRDNLESRDRK